MTLEQFKNNLESEKSDIERKLARGENTLVNVERLQKINDMLHTIEIMDKPDSLYKRAMRL